MTILYPSEISYTKIPLSDNKAYKIAKSVELNYCEHERKTRESLNSNYIK